MLSESSSDDPCELAGVPELADGLVDALGQRAVLVEHDAEVLAALGRRELARDHAALELGSRDVQGRGQVDDEAVDLAVLERLDREVVGVVDLRLLARGDRRVDQVQAGRADLRAELVALEAGDRGLLRELAVLRRDDGLGHVVVAVGQVDRLGALLAEADLAQVDVEVLLARPDRVVERRGDPGDRVTDEAEVAGDRPGRAALEAEAVGRVAELPRVGPGSDGW